MDWEICLLLLVVLCLEGGETGGHGESHHNHVKVRVPEFIHHDHHTKVITIHHHHHKPKKEHHHHHHHHHKPHIPHGHHYHHHQKKSHTKTHTTSKGHKSNHGQHGHKGHHIHHGNHGNHGHHGHQSHHGHKSHHGHENYGHGHGHHHHDTPPISYDPSPITFGGNFGSSFTPSVPAYGEGIASQVPHIHGVAHTVKQVKVFDSLPGVIPSNIAGTQGYEVTEQGEEDDDDVFTSVNSLHHSYPATFGYLRGAAPQPDSHDPFAEVISQDAVQSNNHDPFAEDNHTNSAISGEETFTGTAQSNPFISSAPTQDAGLPSAQPSPEFSTSFQPSGFDDHSNSFAGTPVENTAFFSSDESPTGNDTPVSFSREAGIQQSTKTGAVHTVIY